MANYRLKTFEIIDLQTILEPLKWIGYLDNLWKLFKALRNGCRYIKAIRSYALARVYLAQIIAESLLYETAKSQEEKRQRMNALSESFRTIGRRGFLKDEKFWKEIRDMKTTGSIIGPRLNEKSNKIELVEERLFDTFAPAIRRATKLLESNVNDLKSLSNRNPITFLRLVYEYQFRRNLLNNMLQAVSARASIVIVRISYFISHWECL